MATLTGLNPDRGADRWADRHIDKALRQTGRLALSGTLNGSLVGVPAYSLQGVQSCVTESELLLCPSLQRGYVDILCAATRRSGTMKISALYPG